MTTVAYALGQPHPAVQRGGDCRARDLTQARNVHGPHRFATTTACRITNGLLRLTVGATGAAPSLTVEAWRGKVLTAPDTYTTPAWFSLGTITIDGTLLTALLTQVRVVRLTPEAVTIRLVAPVISDAFVTLRRGERMVRIQHGATRGTLVTTSRRVRWIAPPALIGLSFTGRVEETGGYELMYRFVASNDTVSANVAAFSLTASGVSTAYFGAGVAMDVLNDRPFEHHAQLGDVSRPRIVVT